MTFRISKCLLDQTAVRTNRVHRLVLGKALTAQKISAKED